MRSIRIFLKFPVDPYYVPLLWYMIIIWEVQSLDLKIKLPWLCTCMYLSGQQLVKPQNDLSVNLSDWKAEVQLGLSV